MKSFNWYSYEKTVWPEALFTVSAPSYLNGRKIDISTHEPKELIFGYPTETSSLDYCPPSVMVLEDKKASEVMAWLKIYAPETSPLSQFGRLMTYSDFKIFQSNKPNARIYWPRIDRWPSVILGEILAQGDTDVDIGTLPLSRAQAGFSMAVAKAAIAHTNDSIVDICIERIKQLEDDKKFVHRAVSTNELLPIWRNVGILWDESYPIDKISDIWKKTSSPIDLFSPSTTKFPDLLNLPDLLSDSVENRVVAFQKLASIVPSLTNQEKSEPSTSAMFALAAFLVGRSTSHLFLLKEISKTLPIVYAWFGLIAAILGPKHWDISWSRAVKGVERGLRSKFDWAEASQADLSWIEFNWLSKTFNTDVFAELPKLLPRVLSLELIPGSVCQLRLNISSTTHNQTDRDIQKDKSPNREIELAQQVAASQSALLDFIKLAERSKALLYNNSDNSNKTSSEGKMEVKPSKSTIKKPYKRSNNDFKS